jgi:RNA polymerase sigma-70 factor (ECF subfamily)
MALTTLRTPNQLARRFEEHRGHLRAVAFRMLGSRAEAEDAVREAWIRTSRADRGDAENLGGWLTTVVSRVCSTCAAADAATDPEHAAVLADAVGAALLVVLDQLSPAERLAFVLHDLFGLAFDEVAPIVDRSPAAARQLASRASGRAGSRARRWSTAPRASSSTRPTARR